MALHILPILDHTSNPKPPQPSLSLHGFVINSRFLLTKKIGAGTYGLIYLVKDLATSGFYAAKITLTDLPQGTSSSGVKAQKQFIQESVFEYFNTHYPLVANEIPLQDVETAGASIPYLRETALQLKVHCHVNVATIHRVMMLEKFAVVTLMDYYPQGDLFGNIIEKHVFLNPPPHQDKTLLIKNCMLQLVDVIAHCARHSVYHCDLKPENIMVCYNRSYKRPPGSNVVDYAELRIGLIDFGLAMTSDLICCNVCRGSSFYMAPERIVNFSTSRIVHSLLDMSRFPTCKGSCVESESTYFPTLAGDVWSLGVLFVNLTCARNPWPVANISDRHEVFSNFVTNNRNLLRSILPISSQFNELLKEIFELDPTKRISLGKLAERVVACNFYDVLEYNGQMYTPPATSHSTVSPAVSTAHIEKSY